VAAAQKRQGIVVAHVVDAQSKQHAARDACRDKRQKQTCNDAYAYYDQALMQNKPKNFGAC